MAGEHPFEKAMTARAMETTPLADGVDGDLATLLRGFAARMAAADSPLETLTVSVRRGRRFKHTATTAHGLSFVIDEPSHFGGDGAAADPAEQLLAAVAASVSVTFTAHAALRGLVVDDVRMTISGSIHGDSFFTPNGGAPAGLLDVTLTMIVTSPMSRREANGLLKDVLRASPVYRSLNRRPKVTLHLQQSATR